MILDAFQLFTGGGTAPGNGDGATDSPTTGTQNSSNVLDYGVILGIPSYANGGGARDMGVGDDPSLKLMIAVTTAFAGGTSLGIVLQGAPDNGSGAPGSYTTMYSGPVVVEAPLLAHGGVQRPFACMAEGRMAEVVGKGERLSQIFIDGYLA